MIPSKSENRKDPRIKSRFIVSYRLGEKDKIIELSQINNLSQGGIALNTNIKFPPGTQLILNLHLPMAHEPIKITGRVVESRELSKNRYETRIQFVTVEKNDRNLITNTIDRQLPHKETEITQKREHPRVKSRLIVSYRLGENDKIIELSQINNLSQGGMALNTNIKFPPDTQLILNLHLPMAPESVKIIGRVVESRELAKNRFDTRIKFVNIDEKYRKSVQDTIDYQLKKQRN